MKISIRKFDRRSIGLLLLAVSLQPLATGKTTTYNIPAQSSSAAKTIDYINAQPFDLPIPFQIMDTQWDIINSFTSTASVFTGTAGKAPGFAGNGLQKPVNLGKPAFSDGGVTPERFGTFDQPFTTARADLSSPTNTMYPYRASGKLFFKIGTDTYMCSASLLKRGIVVTAAHCIVDFGKKQAYANWQFIPGYRNGIAPFGVWTASRVNVLGSYYAGTDSCAISGVVCTNDVAQIQLVPQNGAYPGTSTGWYGYAYNGWGFTPSGLTHITQIGYPAGLDSAAYMERNDSYGYKSPANSNNTIIGSLMDGGSSGGPWIANFGQPPVLTGVVAGSYPNPNVIVGVTSWGFTSSTVKAQGASPFLSTNIGTLINTACGSPVSNPRCL